MTVGRAAPLHGTVSYGHIASRNRTRVERAQHALVLVPRAGRAGRRLRWSLSLVIQFTIEACASPAGGQMMDGQQNQAR